MFLARSLGSTCAMVLVAGFATGGGDASAQQIYKIVGPDGRVTFSDTRPSDPNTKATAAAVLSVASDSANIAGLPFELRQAATRYPVTLYTSLACSTCAQGRAMLVSRGIPFSEKLVATKEDGEALSRIAGAQTLPLLTIGGQQLKGYSDSEWNQFLDAAGYPKTSQLPPSYSPAPAPPLVALDPRQPAAAPPHGATAQDQAPARTRRQAEPPAPPTDNPAGIQV